MTSLEEIRDLLKKLTAGKAKVFPAIVVSVDQEKFTAVVQPGDDAELEVRLRSAINNSQGKFVLIPKVKSTVLVAMINNDESEGVVVAYDEIDLVSIQIGDQTFDMDTNGHRFNGGTNGGLIVHEQLLNEYNKTRQVVDAIVDTLTNWAVVPTDGGAALKAAFGLAIAGKQTGDLTNITNDKVTH